MLAMQFAAPNSPQFFNTGLFWAYGITGPDSGQWAINYDIKAGVIGPFEAKGSYEYPQPHACFIQPVADDLVGPGGIMDLVVRESRLFKHGSGTGTNFSNIRAKGEKLGGGGTSSGLMSFLEVGDRAAGAIKSGGTTRRAAKMVCLDLDHPEIEDFINWKVREESKAAAMAVGSRAIGAHDISYIPNAVKDRIDNGFEAEEFSCDWEGEAIRTVSGQNSNNSVRVTDSFLLDVDQHNRWSLRERTTGKETKVISARDLWNQICRAAWASADPGVQFDDTINAWNTCAADARINASNPCGEYNFLDNTACNLASLNLTKFLQPDGTFDVPAFTHATRLWTIVLDISVSMASFPSREIALDSYKYRTLGLGYANVGGLLMRSGIAYDSDVGRDYAASITALMHGITYKTSAELAAELGSFPRWEHNKESMTCVLGKHRAHALDSLVKHRRAAIEEKHIVDLAFAVKKVWENLDPNVPFRNAQTTLIAPTGTIALLMDCDTTGIEPEFALKKTKLMASGGTIQSINSCIWDALERLGYKTHEINLISNYLTIHGHFEGCPDLKPEHLDVFDCAMPPVGSTHCLSPMAHVLMVAAVQLFLSGAVSKTVNLPNSATITM
jgi:ribonucleoside-diphosphate reductase alpha chain